MVTNRIAALPIFAAVMILVYFVSITTVGTWATDWTNDGLFGDGYHLFGNGTDEYEEAITAYAEENLWTNEMVAPWRMPLLPVSSARRTSWGPSKRLTLVALTNLRLLC